MKLHDFGLWFRTWPIIKWSTTIPDASLFMIFYDGEELACQDSNRLEILVNIVGKNIFILNSEYERVGQGHYSGCKVTSLADFTITPNPDYKSEG